MINETIRFSRPISLKGTEVDFGKILDRKGLSDELVGSCVGIANRTLPSNYDRIDSTYFLSEQTVSGGRTYDLTSQWRGNILIARRKPDDLTVGFWIGNLYEDSGQKCGFSRLVAVDEPFKGIGIGQTLMYLMLKGFLDQGAAKVSGSTSETNSIMRGMAEKFPVIRRMQSTWIRYSVSSKKAERMVRQQEKRYPEICSVWESLESVSKSGV